MRQRKFNGWSRSTKASLFLFAFVLCFAFINGCACIANQSCMESRTAFDIGSATIKMKTAKINKCRQVSIRTIQQKEVKVPFAEHNRNHLLSPEIQNIGIEQLQLLKREALEQGAQTFTGVATAVFRHADNAPRFLADVKAQTGINIRLISQDEEAVLGYQAALEKAKSPSAQIIVWDIGGNSMQITMKNKDQHYRVYRGHMASVSFKNQILEKVHHHTSSGQDSPNPIGRQNLAAALAIAMNAAANVPDEIKSYIRQTGTGIIGIGGVHNRSIRKQVSNESTYRREDLINALKNKLDLTDSQIGGLYADTDVSNLILVLGFMEKLDIEEVYLTDVNLTDGILINPAFW